MDTENPQIAKGSRYWESPSGVTQLRRCVRASYERVFAILAQELSGIHQIGWTAAQWAICLDLTVYTLAAFYWDRLAEHDEDVTFTAPEKKIEWDLLLCYSAAELLSRLAWKPAALGTLKQLAAAGDRTVVSTAFPDQLHVSTVEGNSRTPPKCRWSGRLLIRSIGRRISKCLGQPPIAHSSLFMVPAWKLTLSVCTFGLARTFIDPDAGIENRPIAVSKAQRQLLFQRCSKSAEFSTLTTDEQLFLLAVCRVLPLAYLEDFSRLRQAAGITMPAKPVAVCTTLGFLESPVFAIYAAECQLRGALMVGVQHGGFYGEVFPTHFEEMERKHSDYYVTYGWRENVRDVALPSPRLLSRSPHKPAEHSPNRLKILWATVSHEIFLQSIYFAPTPRTYSVHANHSSDAINRVLNATPSAEIDLRPHPGLCDQNIIDVYRQSIPSSRFGMNPGRIGTLRSVASQYNVTVFDYLGATGFLECVAARIPALIYAAPQFGSPRASAMPIYSECAKAGIFCTNPDELLASIQQIADQGVAWFQRPEYRQAIKSYKRNFARTSPYFFWIPWTLFFWKLYLGSLFRKQKATSL